MLMLLLVLTGSMLLRSQRRKLFLIMQRYRSTVYHMPISSTSVQKQIFFGQERPIFLTPTQAPRGISSRAALKSGELLKQPLEVSTGMLLRRYEIGCPAGLWRQVHVIANRLAVDARKSRRAAACQRPGSATPANSRSTWFSAVGTLYLDHLFT